MASNGRIRINAGYLHQKVVEKLDDVAQLKKYRSLFPAIEELAKKEWPVDLKDVEPGSYGIEVEQKRKGEK